MASATASDFDNDEEDRRGKEDLEPEQSVPSTDSGRRQLPQLRALLRQLDPPTCCDCTCHRDGSQRRHEGTAAVLLLLLLELLLGFRKFNLSGF